MRIHIPFSRWLVGLFVLFFASTSVFAAPNTRSPIGINSNEVMDDDASIPFIDVFKTSIPFEEARPWLTKGNIVYDKDGWPKKLNGGQAGTRFLYKLPRHTVPEGYYTVLYDGEGKLEYSDDAKLIKREPGKDIISIRAGKDKEFRVKLIIKHSNENNYLRNIRVLLPGGICSNNPYKRVNNKKQCRGSYFLSFEKYHDKLIFNPDYLNYMKDFKVIRFMNMSGITRNPISSWDKRPKVTNETWGGKSGVRGAPLEIMVALANKLNADAWFNIPHKANNNYVRQYAEYVKNNLKPNLKAYVEYTNEAWNTIFSQAHYVKDMGERMQLDDDRDKAGYKYFSLRSVQIFDMWEQVFGGTNRIVRVMGSWTGYTRLSEMLLTYRNAYKKTDAIAIAPYFFPSMKSVRKAHSVSQIFKLLYDPKEPYSIPKVLGYIHKNAEMAKKYGVDLIAYEGGQHLVDWKSRSTTTYPTKLMIAANKDWRMAKAYSIFMRGWKDNGGKLFVNFSAPRTYQWFGSWGTKEYITQSDSKAPKHRALMHFKRKNPCWWKSCTSPAIARLEKPATSPTPNIFALVPSKNKRGKTRLAAAKPNKSVIGTQTPAAKRSSKVAANISNPAATPSLANSAKNSAKKALVKVAKNVSRHAASVSVAAVNAKQAGQKALTSMAVTSGKSVAKSIVKKTTNTLNNEASPGKPIWARVAKNATTSGSRNTESNTRINNSRNKQSTAQNHDTASEFSYKQDKRIASVQPDAVVHRAKGRSLWSKKAAMPLSNVVGGTIHGGSDLSASWQTYWDNKYLYVRVDTKDDTFIRDSKNPWSDDSIELYIDADGSRTRKFDGRNDFHFIYRWKDAKVNLSKSSPHRRHMGIQQTMTRTNTGYTLETAIPWKTLGVRPVAGKPIGIDIQINDDDNGQERDAKLAWHAKNDQAWKNPRVFGKLVLGI